MIEENGDEDDDEPERKYGTPVSAHGGFREGTASSLIWRES